MNQPFIVKEETWFDINPKTGKLTTVTCPTIRPRRRRSWTEDALRSAWTYLMDQPDPERFRVSGSNATTLAVKMGLLTDGKASL